MKKKREPLAEETIDGLELEMRLAADSGVRARKEAYFTKLRAFRDSTAAKSKAEMIAELKVHNPAYIVSLLESRSEAEIHDRYVNTFGPKERS